MTKLTRCSPERELHDKEARIRELEAALHDARHFVYRCLMEEYAKGAGHNTLESLVTRMDSLLATSPPDSEPAEGEGGGPDHSRDFDGTDPRGMGPLPGEPGNPNPSFEQMDAMLERREALASLDRIDNMVVLDTPNGRTTLGDHKRDEVETIRQALSRTSDEGTGCVVPEVVRRLPENVLDRALSELAVPEAVRRLPEHWRSVRLGEQPMPEMEFYAKALNLCASQLDRAIAEQGGQQSDASRTANIIALDHAADILDPDTPEAVRGAHSDHWKRVAARNLRDISDQMRKAAAPQPEHGECDE